MNSLTITLIQTNLHWHDKATNLSMLEEKIKNIQEKKELVVLPEMFNTGFTMHPEEYAETMDGETMQWMKEVAFKNRIILTGSLAIKENNCFYNRLIWMLPNGSYGIYDKRHLFAYANENIHYNAGNRRLIASINGWKINLQICYDLRFPVWARQSILNRVDKMPEYDVLIYVANWPQRRIKVWQTLLQARAIENQCFVAGVNRTGYDGNNIYHNGSSMIVDPLGETLYQGGEDEDVFTITLEKDNLNKTRDKFPFWKDADLFKLIIDN